MILTCEPASAAPIVWQSPTAIVSADQALTQPGQVAYATRWGGGNAAVTLSSGTTINFASGTIDGAGLVQVSGAFGIAPSNTAAYSGTSNSVFNSVLGGFAFDGRQTITLTGLTIGASYSVELFSLDDRGCCASKTQTFSDQAGDVSSLFVHGANDYITGNFVSNLASEVIIGAGSSGPCGANVCSNLNAVVLREAVPEPATGTVFAAGLVGLAGVLRRRQTG